MIKQQHKIHYAWYILVVLCLVMAGCYGIILNNVGVVFNAVLEDTGFASSELSLFYTIRELVSAAAIIPTFQLFQKSKTGRWVLCAQVICILGGFAAMGICTQVWHWYILAVFQAIGLCNMHTVIAVACNSWFRRHNGTVIGIALATSGVISAVFGPVASKIILAIGWRKACFVIGGIGAVIALPGAALLFHKTPQTKQMLPYGYDEAEEMSGNIHRRASNGPKISWGMSMFILCLIFGCCGTVCHMMNQQIALYGRSLSFGLTASAMLNSATMIGNIGGKLGSGMLADRFGAFNAQRVLVGISLTAYVLLCLGSKLSLFAFAGALLLGTLYSSTASLTLFLLRVYGEEDYKNRLTQIQTISRLLGAAGTSMIAFVYEKSGNFLPTFFFCIGLCVLQFVLIAVITGRVKRAEA